MAETKTEKPKFEKSSNGGSQCRVCGAKSQGSADGRELKPRATELSQDPAQVKRRAKAAAIREQNTRREYA